MLLGGKEDFFIQTAMPEQEVNSGVARDDDAGAVEWQQGFKVCKQDLQTLAVSRYHVQLEMAHAEEPGVGHS